MFSFSSLTFMRAKAVFNKRRSTIYDQMAFSLEHEAHPPSEILAMYKMAKRRNSPLAAVYKRWHEQLTNRAAGRLALAMKSTIPTTEYALLASAEETHMLPAGLRFLASSVKRVDEMRGLISQAFKKLILPGVMMFFLFIACDEFFFPTIADTLPRTEWPMVTKLVAAISSQIMSAVGVAAILIPALISSWYFSLSRWTGPARALGEKTMLYSKYRDFQCALFLVNLAFLMTSNHAPRDSLLRIYEHSNRYMRWHIEKMINRLNKDASNAGEALVSTGLFSDEVGDLMSNYARWGDWHTQIRKIADSSLDLVTADIKKFAPALEEGLQLALGLCVMLVFASGGFAVVKVLGTTGLTH